MSKAVIFFAPGLEECEGLLCVDILRRAGVEVTIAAVGGQKTVTSARSIHVVADALSITVRTYDGTEYEAQVVGTDEKTDIAVIKIDADGLNAATFGDSDQLVVGEPAVVIGNPLGLEFANTMTQGTQPS